MEGIAASQRFTPNVEDYGYPAGTKLYQTADGGLTTDRGGEDLPELPIRKAAPENLSAGTAAWVQGELILGTGKDNQTYMEKGEAAASSGGAGDLRNVFSDFTTVKGWMGGLNGTIPYAFTPDSSLLIVLDGPLEGTFDGANLPDSALVGKYYSIFYWQKNTQSSIKIKVQAAHSGFNDTMLVKEW